MRLHLGFRIPSFKQRSITIDFSPFIEIWRRTCPTDAGNVRSETGEERRKRIAILARAKTVRFSFDIFSQANHFSPVRQNKCRLSTNCLLRAAGAKVGEYPDLIRKYPQISQKNRGILSSAKIPKSEGDTSRREQSRRKRCSANGFRRLSQYQS